MRKEYTSIIKRWETRISFIKKTSLTLSENQMLGLIGEIFFFFFLMINEYGVKDAIESYIGTDLAHKDFKAKNIWYEIKSIHHGVRSVKISSLEQLESEANGRLVIITFDQGTPTSTESITLNGIISELKAVLDLKWQLKLNEKMRKIGYIEDERYDEYNYRFIKLNLYNVSGEFPRLLKNSLPNGISKVSYEIDITSIERFEVDD